MGRVFWRHVSPHGKVSWGQFPTRLQGVSGLKATLSLSLSPRFGEQAVEARRCRPREEARAQGRGPFEKTWRGPALSNWEQQLRVSEAEPVVCLQPAGSPPHTPSHAHTHSRSHSLTQAAVAARGTCEARSVCSWWGQGVASLSGPSPGPTLSDAQKVGPSPILHG